MLNALNRLLAGFSRLRFKKKTGPFDRPVPPLAHRKRARFLLRYFFIVIIHSFGLFCSSWSSVLLIFLLFLLGKDLD